MKSNYTNYELLWRNKKPISTGNYLKILKCIESNQETLQQQKSEELGVNLGKLNYLLNALIDIDFLR